MAEIQDLVDVDASNTARFPENMPPSDVNNSGRALEAIVSRWHHTINGSVATTGAANTYVYACPQTLSAYYDGLDITLDINVTNTGASTLNVNSLGAKDIKKNVDAALDSGDLKAGGKYRFVYDGTNFQLMSPPATILDGGTGLSNIVEDTTPQLGGTLDTNSQQVRWSKGADVASANTLVLGTDGNIFDITGTTTINGIATLAVGTVVILHFDGILTLTHNAASFVLPNAGANITTAAGDEAIFYEFASAQWRCIGFSRADGSSVGVTGKKTQYVPAGAMRPTVTSGCANLAVAEGTAGQPNQLYLAFDATADENAQFSWVFPTSWDRSTLTFRVDWTTTNTSTNGVAWALQAVAVGDNDAIDVAFGSAVVITDNNQSAAGDVLRTAESSALTVGGSPADGDMVFFNIYRDVSNAADDMTQDARLLGVEIFYTVDSGNDA